MDNGTVFRVNSPQVVSETIDGEVVIVNLDKGIYYSLLKTGADVWSRLERQLDRHQLIQELARSYDGSVEEIEIAIDEFIANLLAEELIVIDPQPRAAKTENNLDRLLSDLKDIGIEAIVLGEAARSSDENYRQISSFHLLVREHDLESAIQHLTALNWHSCDARSPTAIHLQDDRQHSLYLQGRLFWAIPQAHTDELVWQYATPRAGDVAGWQLSATDLLLHLCARMFYKQAEPQLADLAAAMLLMKPGSDLDWLRPIAQAQRYQLILPVRNTIGLLERVLQVSPPEWVLPALWQMPISELEWLNCRVLAGDRQGWRRSQLAFASDRLHQLFAPLRQLRSHPFPGRQILKNLLKPTTSALE